MTFSVIRSKTQEILAKIKSFEPPIVLSNLIQVEKDFKKTVDRKNDKNVLLKLFMLAVTKVDGLILLISLGTLRDIIVYNKE